MGDQVEEMSKEDISLLEKIVNALTKQFGNAHPSSPQARSYTLRSQAKSAKEEEEFDISSAKEVISRTPEELKRKRAQLDEEINEEVRATKRKRVKESQELDAASDARRLKDIRHDGKQEEILNDDLKNSSKKEKSN
ncbi:MAG: hypothetical protein HWD61_04690 [Parachlamydiaceae bacterium]|nr:MAG: hypothetical protein HWD61_04690 [Parachlamydiaceae bacterium]